ncbi:polyketide synthase [Mycobacterium leprae Kyoto-2]|uniref:Phenolphthiocerol/phthiocerol polyketide synthase subunit E n=3 Tax=Mycobacterium leprae TaxID=1769 RepID=Q49934_MYCLE|nr:type I polyketide synthase [Mycobacterium leprae]CAR72451.1 polyketide synthase [Mycobacterium leprae Br4923]AAA17358.1 pksF [Mycobacterium leprae]AWV48643.1 polyketide synthase [Mycobacterium leprae]OAR21102.1 polyketide synthase [Mycobacterium leprae 3125609]OAX72101.1 polyketide synthase [Mycobacterium leprae 7935681]
MITPDNAIAVVGMAGKFPGANDVSAFWTNLRRGKESIVTLSEQELRDNGVSDKALADPAYVRRAPLLDGIDEFDADFFGLPPLAAQVLDPQHRLFLQCAWHALEDAGCDPAQFDGSIGVYGTSSPSGYLLHNLLSHRDPHTVLAEGLNFDQFSLFLQNDKDFLATRISHAFNLRGPSIAVQTACSSSLVALHLACLSLLSGECDMALAGGSSLCIPHRVGYWHSPGSMVSAVGHCRPFDVRADGTVFGSGVALVALKPLQAAIDASDRIHAVILGSAINNDGSMKMGYAAPNPAAQADVIAEAHAVAGIDSSTVSYVETHGTGTPLGDPIEIQGLKTAFEVSQIPRPGPCVLGSVKSNIGHLEVAAGIAGLIKTILCLKNKAIPATLHYTSPNRELRLDQTPFVVQSNYGPWKWDGVRRAGVSSFGVGGTNVHVVLEEASVEASTVAASTGPQVILLSAQTAAALGESREALATVLEKPGAPDLSDVAYTLAGRRKHNITMAAVVRDREHAVTVLRAAEHDNVFVGESGADTGRSAAASITTLGSDRVVFLFPGQGAQHVGMAKGLYDTESVFAEHFDTCSAGFREAMDDLDLHSAIFNGTAIDLERIDRSQPALFTVEYALAKLVESFGVGAGAYIGYSTGEYIAATLAGVFDLETAIKTVSLRARLMHESPPGAMVAVALGPEDITEYLAEYSAKGVELSAVNDPGNCVVAGPKDQIRAFSQRLDEVGIPVRRVRATHAFHTSSMEPMLREFSEFLSRQQLRVPNTPLLSNLTGTWMSEQQVTDPENWTRQISSTIRFADELDVVLSQSGRVLVEVGPGGSLTGSAMRHPRWSSGHRAVRLMRHPLQNVDDHDTFLRALGELWSAGIEVDWAPQRSVMPHLVSLPGYPFARQRHWVEPRYTIWAQIPGASSGSPVDSSVDSATVEGVRGGESQTEATLQRIWSQCLGVSSVDRNANFFDLGGDSLMAISISMAAANEGMTITPQDMYEHPTLASLTAAVDASFASSGLAKPPEAAAHPAVPPNIAYFLERGLCDTGRWRVPLILRLDPKIGSDDIRAVLTAVVNHHDVLRLSLVDNDGMWEQHIAATGEFTRLLTQTLPDGVAAGSAEERAVVSSILAELIASQSDLNEPLTAVQITTAHGGPHYLGLAVHQMVIDDASRQILGTDIITAFGQRLAGEEITLEPVTTGWREWSLRCAALATHPAALDTRSFWIENANKVNLWLADVSLNTDVIQPPGADDLIRMPCTLSVEQTSELDDARRRFRRSIQAIVLAALGRTIAQTVGDGVVAVELEGEGRSVLRPDVDVRRTIGWFTNYYPIPLVCVKGQGALAQLDAVHNTLKSIPHYGIGYGLLRYMYAPTGRVFSAQRTPDIHFRYVGVVPEPPSVDATVQFDSDMTIPVQEPVPGMGHAIELRTYRFGGSLHLDWWYDIRRIPQVTAEALAQSFPVTLSKLIQEGIATQKDAHDESEMAGAPQAGVLVDLSTLDAG